MMNSPAMASWRFSRLRLPMRTMPGGLATQLLAIQKALIPCREDLKTKYGSEFRMRIGINSGPVIVDVKKSCIGRDAHDS